MAEPKRHMDVPKERVLESLPPNQPTPRSQRPVDPDHPSKAPHRPTICHPGPNTQTGVYKCLPMAVYMCLPVMMTTETTTGKAKQATQECSNDTNRPDRHHRHRSEERR